MNFLITALAVFGLSSLLTSYDGAWGVFRKLRDKFPDSFLHCTVCTAVWLSIPIILLGAFVGVWSIAPIAIVGVVIIIERLT